jgi:hypothetical protein
MAERKKVKETTPIIDLKGVIKIVDLKGASGREIKESQTKELARPKSKY